MWHGSLLGLAIDFKIREYYGHDIPKELKLEKCSIKVRSGAAMKFTLEGSQRSSPTCAGRRHVNPLPADAKGRRHCFPNRAGNGRRRTRRRIGP